VKQKNRTRNNSDLCGKFQPVFAKNAVRASTAAAITQETVCTDIRLSWHTTTAQAKLTELTA
jgi:hypothetical protein